MGTVVTEVRSGIVAIEVRSRTVAIYGSEEWAVAIEVRS